MALHASCLVGIRKFRLCRSASCVASLLQHSYLQVKKNKEVELDVNNILVVCQVLL